MKPQMPWARLAAEGVVIVVSILLAFSVDAWWDGVTERERVREQQAQLHTQMLANQHLLEAAVARSRSSLDALRTIVDLVGPDPTLVPQDSLGLLFTPAFAVPFESLGTSAAESRLASSDFLVADYPSLHR